MNFRVLFATAGFLFVCATVSPGGVRIVIDHNQNEDASSRFRFKNVASPCRSDAAGTAKFTIVQGSNDDNGASVEKLHDGTLPSEEDQPSENFFFDAGTKGGRILVDLGSAIEIKQSNSYSWHSNT